MTIAALKEWREKNPTKVQQGHARKQKRRHARGVCQMCAEPVILGLSRCPAHRRYASDWAMLKNTGASRDWFDATIIAQTGKCPICDVQLLVATVDHDHVTGNPRSILCSLCNAGIGQLRDDVSIVEKALLYLRQFNLAPDCRVVSK